MLDIKIKEREYILSAVDGEIIRSGNFRKILRAMKKILEDVDLKVKQGKFDEK